MPLVRVVLIVALVVLGRPHSTAADEVKVLCSNGLREVMREVLPSFERTTSHTVTIVYDLSANLARRIDGGEAFDVAVLTPSLIDDLTRGGKVAGESRVTLARSAITFAMRTGHARPDFSSADALTRTLRSSASLAYAREGASAAFFLELVERLGLAGAGAPRIQALPSGAVVGAAVARGDVEFGVIPVSEILPIAGIEVAGTLPDALRGYITMTAGVNVRPAAAKAASELLAFLTSTNMDPVLRKRGMERVQ